MFIILTFTSRRATIILDGDQRIERNAGDSVGLLCKNAKIDVDWLIDRIDFGEIEHADKPFCIHVIPGKSKSAPTWLPEVPVTVRFLLTYCFELHAPVTRRIARVLATCCTRENPLEDMSSDSSGEQSLKLLKLSSREGSALFDKWVMVCSAHECSRMATLHSY